MNVEASFDSELESRHRVVNVYFANLLMAVVYVEEGILKIKYFLISRYQQESPWSKFRPF